MRQHDFFEEKIAKMILCKRQEYLRNGNIDAQIPIKWNHPSCDVAAKITDNLPVFFLRWMIHRRDTLARS